jgi:hypothetical protein
MLSNVARVACLELVLSLRIPASVTYVFMLPALLLLLFGNRYSRVGVLVTGLTALVTGISTLQGVGQVTATMRHGIWKTIRVSLHPEWLYLAGVVASRVVRTLLVAAMLLACAWIGFGYSIQGSVAGHFALVVLGSATFAALGLLLAYLPAAPATASTVMNVALRRAADALATVAAQLPDGAPPRQRGRSDDHGGTGRRQHRGPARVGSGGRMARIPPRARA